MTRAVIRAAAVCALVVVWATPAHADHLDLEPAGPPQVAPGDLVEIEVTLRDSATQQLVPGATVVASRDASIVGVSSSVVLATATTDAQGKATLRWQQRASTDHVVLVAFGTVGDVELESQEVPVVVVGPERQVVREESGIQIPGFGAWLLIGVIVAVWGLIQFSLVGPMSVATRSHPDDSGGEDEE